MAKLWDYVELELKKEATMKKEARKRKDEEEARKRKDEEEARRLEALEEARRLEAVEEAMLQSDRHAYERQLLENETDPFQQAMLEWAFELTGDW